MAVLLKQWNETGTMPEQWRKSKRMRAYIKKRYPKTYGEKLEQLDTHKLAKEKVVQSQESEIAEYDLSEEFSQYVVDGIYSRYQENPGQRQFSVGDRVLVNDNGLVNEPARVSLSYNRIWKDIQITGVACYWVVFDRGAEMAAADPRFKPCNVEVGHLKPM
jgi:hypothetical protein